MKQLYGAIEAGGTKMICAVGDLDYKIIKEVSIETTTPTQTLRQIIDFFYTYKCELIGMGVGSFGPIDIHLDSKTYGHITNTPKVGWQNYDFLGELKKHFTIPIVWTTDVNAAAYGEYTVGCAKDVNSCVYYTVGTGVGAGAIQDDIFIGAFTHTEMGHMLVHPHEQDHFRGSCSFHANCLEGLASGPSIETRYNMKGEYLPSDHEVWEYISYYLAQCAFNTTLFLAPDVIIFGGGVMRQKHLLKMIQDKFSVLNNGYAAIPHIHEYIVLPQHVGKSAILGCFALADKEVHKLK